MTEKMNDKSEIIKSLEIAGSIHKKVRNDVTPFLISNAHYLRHIEQILKFCSFLYFSVFSSSHLSHSSLYILIKG